MYSNISQYFKQIFPLNETTANFLLKTFANERKILDMACGDGKYTIPLTTNNHEVVGVDNNAAMIETAKGINPLATFYCSDFLQLTTQVNASYFDGIFCIGNSIVHLANEIEITQALQQLYQVLKPRKKCVLQIVNYDRIFNQQLDHLPTIKNENIVFERLYHYHSNIIDFHTKLIVDTQLIQEQHQKLYGIRKNELTNIAQAVGFDITAVYGNYNLEPWSEASFYTIFILEKEE